MTTSMSMEEEEDKHSDFVVNACHQSRRRSWSDANLAYQSRSGEEEEEEKRDNTGAEEVYDGAPPRLSLPTHRLLPATDARRTAFLSRRWRFIWCAAPSFNFDEREFHGRPLPLLHRYRSRLNFIKFVEDAIEARRSLFRDLTVDEFKVSLRFFQEMGPHLDEWIAFALEKNVKELSIIAEMKDLIAIAEFFQPYRVPYQLPNAVFSSRSLQSLELVFCDSTQISLPSIHLPSLKNLEMIIVHTSDSVLQGILSGSPLLEKMSLSLVCGLNKIQISNQNLKMLVLLKCSPLQEAIVTAPNLESLLFRGKRHSSDRIDISSCRKLKFLWLQRATNLTDQVLERVTLQNPDLEVMILSHCSALRQAVINSPKLWMFVIFKCKHLGSLRIEAPSLTAFEYSGHMINFPSVVSSPNLDAVIHMDGGEISSRWYTKLKDMCAKFEGCRKLWIRCEHDVDLIIPQEMRKRLQPQLHSLKELKIHVRSGILNFPVLEDGIRWIFPGLNNLYIDSDGLTRHFRYSGATREVVDVGMPLRRRKCRSFIQQNTELLRLASFTQHISLYRTRSPNHTQVVVRINARCSIIRVTLSMTFFACIRTLHCLLKIVFQNIHNRFIVLGHIAPVLSFTCHLLHTLHKFFVFTGYALQLHVFLLQLSKHAFLKGSQETSHVSLSNVTNPFHHIFFLSSNKAIEFFLLLVQFSFDFTAQRRKN